MFIKRHQPLYTRAYEQQREAAKLAAKKAGAYLLKQQKQKAMPPAAPVL